MQQSDDHDIPGVCGTEDQSTVSASGDDGEFNSSTYSFPGVDPYITQVGGTDLTTTGQGGAWSAETAWAQSGGGYDSGTPIPSWQQLPGVVNSSNLGSTTLRNSLRCSGRSGYTGADTWSTAAS